MRKRLGLKRKGRALFSSVGNFVKDIAGSCIYGLSKPE
jgi:hypothetical protein